MFADPPPWYRRLRLTDAELFRGMCAKVVARGAIVFKTFNQTGAENVSLDARFPIRPVMFVAGDDAAPQAACHGARALHRDLAGCAGGIPRMRMRCPVHSGGFAQSSSTRICGSGSVIVARKPSSATLPTNRRRSGPRRLWIRSSTARSSTASVPIREWILFILHEPMTAPA